MSYQRQHLCWVYYLFALSVELHRFPPVKGVPTEKGSIRLKDGGASYQGRVEIYYNGDWYTICDDKFDVGKEGTVVCKQLGFLVDKQVEHNSKFKVGRGRILLDDLHCTGTESSLLDCPRNNALGSHNCNAATETVGVVCDYRGTEGSVRLQNGQHRNEGQLQVLYNGTWHTVCTDGITMKEASIVCKQMGYPTASMLHTFGGMQLTGGIGVLPWKLNCSGGEKSIKECISENGLTCTHSKDVGIVCQQEYGPADGSLRLQGSTDGGLSGRLEIYHNSHWGTVCNQNWTKAAADVACRQLGHGDSVAPMANVPAVANLLSKVWLSGFQCTGRETNLTNCENITWEKHNCIHDQDVGISCLSKCTDNELRLSGSGSSSKGYPQVRVNGVWYNVCTYGWGTEMANVVCRAMGFLSFKQFHSQSSTSTSTKYTTWASCLGTENCLSKCSSHSWAAASKSTGPLGINFCYDYPDKIIECKVPQTTTLPNSTSNVSTIAVPTSNTTTITVATSNATTTTVPTSNATTVTVPTSNATTIIPTTTPSKTSIGLLAALSTTPAKVPTTHSTVPFMVPTTQVRHLVVPTTFSITNEQKIFRTTQNATKQTPPNTPIHPYPTTQGCRGQLGCSTGQPSSTVGNAVETQTQKVTPVPTVVGIVVGLLLLVVIILLSVDIWLKIRLSRKNGGTNIRHIPCGAVSKEEGESSYIVLNDTAQNDQNG